MQENYIVQEPVDNPVDNRELPEGLDVFLAEMQTLTPNEREWFVGGGATIVGAITDMLDTYDEGAFIPAGEIRRWMVLTVETLQEIKDLDA